MRQAGKKPLGFKLICVGAGSIPKDKLMSGMSKRDKTPRALMEAILGRPFGSEITRDLKTPDIQATDRVRLERMRQTAKVFGELDRVPRFNCVQM